MVSIIKKWLIKSRKMGRKGKGIVSRIVGARSHRRSECKIPKPLSSCYTKNGRKDDRDADGNLTEEGKKYSLVYL